MPLYIFGCSQGHRSERLVPAGTERSACVECGEDSPRVYGYSMGITQPEVDTRGMFRRFQEASQEMEHRGHQGPSLWHVAKQRAKAIERANENPYRRVW